VEKCFNEENRKKKVRKITNEGPRGKSRGESLRGIPKKGKSSPTKSSSEGKTSPPRKAKKDLGDAAEGKGQSVKKIRKTGILVKKNGQRENSAGEGTLPLKIL